MVSEERVNAQLFSIIIIATLSPAIAPTYLYRNFKNQHGQEVRAELVPPVEMLSR